MNKKDYASIMLILAMFLAGAYLYPEMPEKMAVHWNASGEVDGYGSRTLGVFALPAMAVAIYGLFLLIPKIEVFKENLKSFIGYYDNIKLLLILFMAVIYAATLAHNLGYRPDINVVVPLAVAGLFYYLGVAMPHMKRNFFVGIRTPWTLANEKVWNQTHVMGGKTFKVNALILLVGVFMPSYMAYVILASVLLNALFLVVYSYWLYQKENKNELEQIK